MSKRAAKKHERAMVGIYFGGKAYGVTRVDGGWQLRRDRTTYFLTKGEMGWECDCPSFVMRLAHRGEACKHIRAMMEAMEVFNG